MAKYFFVQHQNVEIIVENGAPRGGSVVETLVWMKALNSLGNSVLQAKYEEDQRVLKKEFDWVELVPTYNSRKFKKTLVWYTYRLPKIFLALKKSKPDVVYTSIPQWHTFYLGLMCKFLGIKHIIRIANDKNVNFDLDNSLSYFDKKLINHAYRDSDLILAQSEYQYQELKVNFPNNKVEKLYNPIEIKKNYLKVKKEKLGYIAWVANFRHQKNLKLLFEIASICKNEIFKIAGQPLVPLDEETGIFVDKLKTLDNVEFVGIVSQSEILEFLSHAKFLLSTSRYEGFSNTFLEAMIVGLPIITTYNVNPDGIINKYQLGFLYEDSTDFKSKLDQFDSMEYTSLSHNCIAYISENHDHLSIGKKLIEYIGLT
jgi:glycosyltransferase involved in cell wall biosynthesis